MEQNPDGTCEEQSRQQNAAVPPPPPPPSPKESADAQGLQLPENQQPRAEEQERPAIPSRIRRILGLLNRSEWAMVALTAVIVVLTAVIAGTGVVGIILVIQGGHDTERIRDAAEKQACAASKSAQAARDFADTTALINGGIGNAVKNLGAQAKATQKAAATASNSLHVSERAYISTGSPHIDWTRKSIAIPLENKGHIPSGPVEISVFEATTIATLHPPFQPSYFTDSCWRKIKIETIESGSPVGVNAGQRYFDAERIRSGLQTVELVIKLSYNDGFPKTPLQKWETCTVTSPQEKTLIFSPCFLGKAAEQIITLSGYPNPRKECDVNPQRNSN